MTQPTPTTKVPLNDDGARGDAGGRSPRWHLVVLALIAYVPLLYTHPGWIAADTKAYLYLDPGRLLSSARYMWDALVGMGTVTHQNIGYLFPMGPWYVLFHAIGVPTWIAQRLWMGTLIFAAGTGVRYLARLLGISAWGQLAAALPYMLSPFIIDYIARTSAILMPWAGLGWMLGFIVVASRRGGWRYPALFALVIALVGGVNATSILLVGLAPALWLVLAGLTKEHPWSRLVSVALKAGGLSAIVSIWWAAGLWAEGSFGINVLQYTETFPTVTLTSLSSEVLRGLGYWYFYGNDAIQPWTQASADYMSHLDTLALSFVLPAIALLCAAFVRWRYRAFAVLVTVLGVVVAVGAYPLSDPSPVGKVARAIGENSTIGLAMRSSNRVVPLVVLGLSLLTGAAVAALASWRPKVSVLVSIAVCVIACANLAPFFEGKIVATNLMFPETLPSYVTSTATYLDSLGTTPVLGIPGEDFGYYTWGVTMDSVWPGLLTRGYIARQAVLQGEPASANLLRALDEPIQDGILDPSSIAPIARLMGVGDILLQSNTQFARFDGPRPQALWLQLHPTPSGLTYLRGFGPTTPLPTEVGPIIDETQLAIPDGASYPPALAVYKVADPRALLRTESMQDPLVVAGDGDGLVEAAEMGLLDGTPKAIVYAASESPAQLAQLAAAPGTVLVLTDTNAKRLDTWGTLHTTYGYVEQAGATPLTYNPAEQDLPIFETQAPDTQTTLLLHGIKSVGASGYGNAVANDAEDQPLNAVDGNPLTAWQVGAFGDPVGQFIKVTYDHPTPVDRVFLQQVQTGVRDRWITSATLRFSSGPAVHVTLSAASRGAGETITFPSHDTTSLTVTIDRISGPHLDFSGTSGVGFAEINVPGVEPVTSSLLLPTDLLSAAGRAGDDDPLVILVNRLRAATVPPRTDPELSMSRTFELPSARTFTVTGKAIVSTLISDRSLDALVGRGGGIGLHVTSTSSSTRLVGSLTNSSWAAFDASAATSWSPAFLAPGTQYVAATLSARTTLSSLALQVVDDNRHSLPTSMLVTSSSGQHALVALHYPAAAVPAGTPQGAVTTLDVHFAPLTGQSFRFSFPDVAPRITEDHISGSQVALPIGIAGISMPGVAPAATPTQLPGACQSNLLFIDGHSVPVRITGSTANALGQVASTVTGCGAPVTLAAGTHVLTTAPGYEVGWNIDTLALTSIPHRAAVAVGPTAQLTAVRWTSQVSLAATVGAQQAPSWLVLNQSFSKGWQATLNGRSLGHPTLLDGGFTAWRLPATAAGSSLSITWAPQGTVDIALLVSALGLLAVLVLIAVPPHRGRRALRASSAAALAAPALSWPWRVPRAPSLALAAVATVVAMAIAGPGVAIVIVPLVAVAWWRPRLRLIAALTPAALLVATGAYMVVDQHTHLWPHSIQWPTHFGLANTLAWVAVTVLLVDVAAFGEGGAAVTPRVVAPRRRPTVAAPPDPAAPPKGLARMMPKRLLPTAAALAPGRFAPPIPTDEGDAPIISLPGGGVARSVALFRAFRHEQADPDLFYRTIAIDTLHRLTGATPIFNRTVVDIGGGAGYFAETFADAGAHVVLIEPEAADPLPVRLSGPDERLSPQERHERAVWPGRLVPAQTIAGDGLNLPLPDAVADVVFSSNVLEHVADPARFLDEAVRITKPGGLVYMSFTAWWSPWGGHETSPWHFVSGRYALRRYTKRHGRPPKNVFGTSLFALRVGTVIRLVEQRRDAEVVSLEPRYYPAWAKWVVRVPVVRELLTWNLVVLLEKH